MKKKYSKPVVKKNQPLVNITFATGAGSSIPVTGGASAPAVP